MSQIRLNEKQKEAVDFNGGDLLIIAGAGTGKTAVLTQRVVNIIKQEWAKPSEILALTFTEKAAQEMQERVDMEMEYGYEEPLISTFHSFCDTVLREDGYNIGLDSGYSLMSATQSYIFLRRYFYDLPLKSLKPRGNPTKFINDLIKHFSRLQDEDVSPQDYLEFASSLPKGTEIEQEEYQKTKELAETYKYYSNLKIEKSKVDFGDLIILTLKLFRERPNVLEKYRKRFKYILVDEFQDTNFTQNVLVNTLVLGDEKGSSSRPLLTVVGDDDQAIYKFRGAAISNILQFKDRYPEAKEVVLVENYRSKQEILDSSYALIRHNNPNRLEITEKIEKKLIARGAFEPDSDSVSLLVSNNDSAEAERVADEILKLTGHEDFVVEGSGSQVFDDKGQSSFVEGEEENYKFSDIAIFVRANSHMDPFLQALRFKGIPYKVGGSRGLYFRDEIKNLIAFLRVLTDYSDEISMYKLLSMPIWGLSAREYVDLNKNVRKENRTLLEKLEEIWGVGLGDESNSEEDFKNVSDEIGEILSDNAIAGVSSLLQIIDSAIKKVKDNRPVLEIMYEFAKDSGYIDSFVEIGGSEGMFAVSNINKFFDLVKQYEKDNPDSNVYEYIDYLNYSIEVGDSPQVDQSELEDFNGVHIMTVHGSKGLEFPVVFLVNLVSQRFPSNARSDSIPIPEDLIKETLPTEVSLKEAHIQEERRLFYVGSTRAKEKLFLTAAYFYGDGKRKKKPSIFLNEILDRDVEEEFKSVDVKNLGSGDISLKVLDSDDIDGILNGDVNKGMLKRFSYSQMNVYETCPRKYEYAHILKVPSKPSPALSFGITVHNALKDFYTLLKRSKSGLEGISNVPTKEDLLGLYEKYWVSNGYDTTKHEEQRKEGGRVIMEKYFDEVFKEEENPLRLEESFSVHVGDIVFVGKIDRIDFVRDNDGVTEVSIVDYKTGKEKKAKDVKDDLQLPLYSLFAEQKFGFKVVSAKYLYVETGKFLEVDVSEERREIAKEKLLEVIDRIQGGDFKANPGFHCRFCDYNSICKYADV